MRNLVYSASTTRSRSILIPLSSSVISGFERKSTSIFNSSFNTSNLSPRFSYSRLLLCIAAFSIAPTALFTGGGAFWVLLASRATSSCTGPIPKTCACAKSFVLRPRRRINFWLRFGCCGLPARVLSREGR